MNGGIPAKYERGIKCILNTTGRAVLALRNEEQFRLIHLNLIISVAASESRAQSAQSVLALPAS